MRNDVKQLCVTTCGAVLEFKGWHNNGGKPTWYSCAHIADPNCIDSGQYISYHEIVLIARKKQTNAV